MTHPVPASRRAVAFETFGPPEGLRLQSLPTPAPGDDEVLMRVRAATINPTDLLMLQGNHAAMMRELAPPYIAGMECAGTVAAMGRQVYGLALGQPVMGIVNPRRPQGGAQAEFVCLPAASVTPLPTGTDWTAAATLPMNGLTARMCLEWVALPAGASLLVTGAAGAVGGFVIGLARAAGLRVIADARETDRPLLTALGAQALVSRGEAFAREVRALCPDGVDAVVDAALLGEAAAALVRPGGFIVSLRRSQQVRRTDIGHAHVSVLEQASRTEALADLVDQMSAGVLVPRIAHTFAMADAAGAYRLVAQGGLRGRVVLTMD